jgi:hypothetical protein
VQVCESLVELVEQGRDRATIAFFATARGLGGAPRLLRMAVGDAQAGSGGSSSGSSASASGGGGSASGGGSSGSGGSSSAGGGSADSGGGGSGSGHSDKHSAGTGGSNFNFNSALASARREGARAGRVLKVLLRVGAQAVSLATSFLSPALYMLAARFGLLQVSRSLH